MIASQRIAESIARTETTIFEKESNDSPSGVFIIDITAGATISDTITVIIEGFDPASKKYYNILTSVVLDAVSTTILKVGMEYTDAANTKAEDFLPRKYRIAVNKNNTTPITYSIGGNFYN